jgi:hypothetical protein
MHDTKNAGGPLGDDPSRLFDESLLLLSSVRGTLAGLLEDLMSGNASVLKDIASKHAELETALKRAFETEQRFNDWNARRTGGVVPGEVDFASARNEIGCRLARLRACCDPG